VPAFGVYLNEKELEFVRGKGKGWLRRVVQHQMKIAEEKKA